MASKAKKPAAETPAPSVFQALTPDVQSLVFHYSYRRDWLGLDEALGYQKAYYEQAKAKAVKFYELYDVETLSDAEGENIPLANVVEFVQNMTKLGYTIEMYSWQSKEDTIIAFKRKAGAEFRYHTGSFVLNNIDEEAEIVQCSHFTEDIFRSLKGAWAGTRAEAEAQDWYLVKLEDGSEEWWSENYIFKVTGI